MEFLIFPTVPMSSLVVAIILPIRLGGGVWCQILGLRTEFLIPRAFMSLLFIVTTVVVKLGGGVWCPILGLGVEFLILQ